ncbi:DUF4350 domain-containing protein [Planotetraspora sp. GP83]|uniref:DUF4350 domain-containing protein n=1 Tax=Planotetraspora sp. GP83 TaxID=3156264 RepID=UPI003519661B
MITQTTPVSQTPAPAERSVPTSPSAGGLWRRLRGILLVGLLVVAAALVPVLVSSPGTEGHEADPADATLYGSKALAEALGDHRITVERVDSVSDALARSGTDSQLLITYASLLSRHEATRLAAAPGDRLLVGAVPYLDVLASGVTPKDRGARVRSREPDCALREATRAGSAFMGGMAYTAPAGATGCYPAGGKPTLVRYVTNGHTVTVVGDGSFMSNLRLAEDGNAALAMNLAGTKPRLIWLVPPAEPEPGVNTGSGDESLGSLIPPGVDWAVVQLIVAVGVVALWRGRRLGPVVAERLPVVVRAAETVEGRGRLYRARRARDRAALALRAAAVDRVTPRLGLSRTASPDEIVAATAVRTGEEMEHVRFALYGTAPADDAALVALAGYLDAIERQVSDS